MTRSTLAASTGSARPATDRAPSRYFAAALIGGAFLFASTCGFAQIQSNTGSEQQESRSSAMGSAPQAGAPAEQESHKPQSKDAAGGQRGKTGSQGHKSDGAGGFNNGLYGTGAGSNK